MIKAATPEFDEPLVTCPLCRSSSIAPYDRDFRGICVSRCDSCRLLFMNPQYSAAHLSEYYAHYVPNEVTKNPHLAARRRYSKNDNLVWIETFVRPGRFLSIGCGDGLELEIAAERGWRAEGFDVDDVSARRASERTGLPIRSGDFFSLAWDQAAFDCIFMDQVLEHPKNPEDYLSHAFTMLRPGGVLFIGCPNIASISSAVKGWLGRVGLKKERRGRHYDTSHHLFYYSPDVLRNLLTRHFGYEVVGLQGDPLNGRKPFEPGTTWLDRLTLNVRKRLPWLESTMRVLARRPSSVASTGAPRSRAHDVAPSARTAAEASHSPLMNRS